MSQIQFMPDSVIDDQPLHLLLAWHERAYSDAVDAFRIGDFPAMHCAYGRMAELRKAIQPKLIESASNE